MTPYTSLKDWALSVEEAVNVMAVILDYYGLTIEEKVQVTKTIVPKSSRSLIDQMTANITRE